MGWRSQVLRGRLRDQGAVIATVCLVTLVATTLLGTFAFLLEITGDEAVDAALGRAPDSAVTVEASVRVRNADTAATLDAAESTIAETLGALPYESSVWLRGRQWLLPRPEGATAAPLAYPASIPAATLAEHGTLVSGLWPTTARDDAGRLPVNVPDVAARAYGWTVGTTVPVRTLGGQAEDTWVVVGTHLLTGPTTVWTRDPLGSTGHDPAYPVPGTGGRLVTDLWGPVIVDSEALLGADVTEAAHLLVVPRLGDAPPGAVVAAREALTSGQVRLSAALGKVDASGFVRTTMDATIDAAWRELTVTRVGVVVVGLLLVVLATTVMLQAARLLTERRAAEGSLVAARGASPAQLRSLAVLEAAVVAGLTTAVAPWVARVLFERVALTAGLAEAGIEAPPGIPLGVVLACAAVATVLAVALVVPSWHVSGSTDVGAHAHLVRSGADLGLVALGGVALWQLLDYGAPLTRGPDGARLDPVLALGPALVVLAAAVLALRLVGPVARVADALARRSRSLAAPLMAWQVARRPAATAGTTLVMVLAVATATFSHALLTTWHGSQLEQVDLALGTDARIDGVRAERMPQSADARAALADAPAGVALRPVVLRDASVGESLGPGGDASAIDARLLAVDTGDGDALRGRIDPAWSAQVRRLSTQADGRPVPALGATGSPLPGDPQWLVATVTAGAVPAAPGTAWPALAVEDEVGVVAWVSVPEVRLGTPQQVAVEIPRSRGPLHLVAASATVLLDQAPEESVAATNARGRLGHVGLAVGDLRVVDRSAGVTSAGEALAAATDLGTATPLSGEGWTGRAASGAVDRTVVGGTLAVAPAALSLPADPLVVDGEFDMVALQAASGRLTSVAWTSERTVRALVTDELAERAEIDPGDLLTMRVGDAHVRVLADRVVPHLPGAPRGAGLLVDRTALVRAVSAASGVDPLTDAWWLTAPDDLAPRLAADVATATGGFATVRVTERESAVAGPLRVAVPAALSLVTLATGVLVLVGLGAAAAAAVRSRRLELARLQAIGAGRRSLVAGLLGEHALLVVLGTLTGVAIGYGIAAVVAPVLTVSPDGRRPVPAPVLLWQTDAAAVITAGLALTACTVVAVLATVLVRRASGALLRLGDDR